MAHTVIIYENNIVRLIQFGDGAVWTRNRAWEIRALAVVLVPKKTEKLAASHKVSQNRDVYTGRFRKGFNITADTRYARWVHEGTGLAGPLHRMIRPTSGKAMKMPKNSGTPRFIRSSKGMPRRPWLKTAGETVAKRY